VSARQPLRIGALVGLSVLASGTPRLATTSLGWSRAFRDAATCPQLPSGGPKPSDLFGSDAATDYQVTVTGGSSSAYANTSGNTVQFTVQNTGGCSDSYTFSSSTTGSVNSSVSLNPTSSTLPAGYSVVVTATYSVGSPGTGTVKLTAQGVSVGQGTYFITVPSNGPIISLAPHDGDYRDVTKCVANCFDAVAGYATPPYFSWDAPHSVQLVYRSAQAHPMGVVQVNAWDTTTVHPVKMSVQLKRSSGALVPFRNGSTELFFACDSTGGAVSCDSTWNRLAAQFYDSTLTTSDSAYTVVIRSYRADQTFRENNTPARIFIVNESASPFGAGWSIAGVQHLLTQPDGTIIITEGNGSIALFTPIGSCGASCTYTAPRGDFTALTRLSAPGADSAKYTRRYPNGTTVGFYTNGRMDYFKDRFGNQSTLQYNTSLQLIAIVDPAGQADSLGYSSGKLSWIKDPSGRVDSITVDGSGNLTRIKDRVGGLPFQGQYDSQHRLTHWTDRRGGAWGLSYDFASKLATDTAPQVTVGGQLVRPVASFASLERAILVDSASGLGTSGSPGQHVNGATVRARTSNATGYTTSYALDRFGASTLVQEPLGRTTTLQRDSNSAVTRMTSPSGHIVNYVWNGPTLTQMRDSTTGRQVNYRYEATFNQDTLVYGDVDTVHYRWNNGHLDSTRVGGSSKWARYYYAANGRLVSDTDAGGHLHAYHYQSGGYQNTDTVRFTFGKAVLQYDGHGRLTTVTDSLGRSTTTQYDSLGRLTRTIGPLQDTTVGTYDSLYLTQVRDAKGQTYKTWMNALQWPDSTTDMAGGVDRYQYDLNGNAISWTNRRGQTIQATYDSLNQPRFVIVGSDTTKLFSDPAGRYSAVSNRESTDTVKFDAADRVLWQVSCRVLATGSGATCFRDSSSYSIRDLPSSLAVSAPSTWGSSQFTVGYHYTYYDRLDTLTNFAGEKAVFGYTQELFEAGHTLLALNNLSVSYGSSYVWTHRIDELQLGDTGLNRALGWGYRYDALGRVDQLKHGPFTLPDTVRTLSYDAASELTGYSDVAYTYTTQVDSSCTRGLAGDPCPDTSIVQNESQGPAGNYAYDSVGNRKDSAAPGGGLALGNRLVRWQYFRMDYDAAGNLLAKRTLKASDTTQVARRDSLFWSAIGRLDSVHTRDSLGNLTRIGFGYDGWGRRVRKSTPTGTSRYLWDGDALVMQLDSLGNRVAEYTYFPGTDNPESVLRHDRGDTTYYYLQDNPGKVVALLKKTGSATAIANHYGYDPFGVPQGGTVTVADALQYAGREYDTETQLYYNRARYYDPAVGRFASEDPIGLSAGLNQYSYADNDPANSRDPSGLCPDACLTESSPLWGPVVLAGLTTAAVYISTHAKKAWSAIGSAIRGVMVATLIVGSGPKDPNGHKHYEPREPPTPEVPVSPTWRIWGNKNPYNPVAVPIGPGQFNDGAMNPTAIPMGGQGALDFQDYGGGGTTVTYYYSDGSSLTQHYDDLGNVQWSVYTGVPQSSSPDNGGGGPGGAKCGDDPCKT